MVMFVLRDAPVITVTPPKCQHTAPDMLSIKAGNTRLAPIRYPFVQENTLSAAEEQDVRVSE